MRIATLLQGTSQIMAVEQAGRCYPVTGVDYATVLSIVRGGRSGVEWLRDHVSSTPIAHATVTAPLSPGKILAIGLNYLDHVRETGIEQPKRPLVFAKFPSSIVGPVEPIIIDNAITNRIDWEVELGVVIGAMLSYVEGIGTLKNAVRSRG